MSLADILTPKQLGRLQMRSERVCLVCMDHPKDGSLCDHIVNIDLRRTNPCHMRKIKQTDISQKLNFLKKMHEVVNNGESIFKGEIKYGVNKIKVDFSKPHPECSAC